MNKQQRIILAFCIVVSAHTSTASRHTNNLILYAPALIGAATACYNMPLAFKNEEAIAQELVKKLQDNIEKRRLSVSHKIEKLQQRLHGAQANSQKYGSSSSPEEKAITLQLQQAREEYRTIDLDYQIEYLRTRPRARDLKEEYVGKTIGGSLFTFFGIFFATH